MKTASKTLSEELFKLKPEWNDTDFFWVITMTTNWHLSWYPGGELPHDINAIPAYGLDYLLEKLPKPTYIYGVHEIGGDLWRAELKQQYKIPGVQADTPTDAAIQLLINLVKEGIV